jgi:hypothetical protein
MTKKKKKKSKKKSKMKCRNKAYSDPAPLQSQEVAAQTLDKIYNQYKDPHQVYPKLIFKSDSLWTRFLRFFRLVP